MTFRSHVNALLKEHFPIGAEVCFSRGPYSADIRALVKEHRDGYIVAVDRLGLFSYHLTIEDILRSKEYLA